MSPFVVTSPAKVEFPELVSKVCVTVVLEFLKKILESILLEVAPAVCKIVPAVTFEKRVFVLLAPLNQFPATTLP